VIQLAADGGPLAAPSPMQPVPFKEAIAWAKSRSVQLPDVYYGELQGLARAMSFSIAGLAKLDQLQAVKDSLTEALESGETLRDWQKRVRSGAIGLDLPAHRIECLPGNNLVSGAVIRAGHRRWYQGRIVEVVTNNGRKFTATPNHPMLTRSGWVAAGELNSGDDLIGYRRDKDSSAWGNSHKHDSPSAISEIFVTLSKAAVTERIEGRLIDFHGDGSDCHVDVVRTTCDLPFGDFAAIRQPPKHLRFANANFSALTFCPSCHHLIVVSQRCGFCDRPYSDIEGAQFRMDEIVTRAIGQGERVGAFSGGVPRDQISDRNIIAEAGRQPAIGEIQATRISARSAYARLPDDASNPPGGCADGCGDFYDAMPGDIELDRIISLRFRDFSGHVYNLSTAHGYFLIDGLYTGNTIFRTNIQGNYARGRCEQQRRTAEAFPWRMYDAINDSRTRPAHAAMDGFVARHDDPVWRTWYPPCGYSCRCRVLALTDKQAARFQAADAKRMQDPELADARATAKPDKGWDYSVCEEPVRGIIDAKNKRGVSDIVTKAEKATPKKERSKIEMDNLGDVIGLERPDGEEWFVRWSRGINADKKSPNSKDYATGEMHQGLSSVPWPSNESLGKKLKSISEYMFLRLKDPKIRPYIYKAKQIGTDSDGYSLISEISLKAEFSDRFIKMIDKGVAEIIEIVESIESINNRMASVDAIGKSILENSLIRKKKTLADIFALHPDLAEELRAYGIIGLM